MLDLYKDLILDHGINPRNKYIMKNYTNFSTGFNHFCGDKIDIYVFVSDYLIENISFYGSGCSVSIASASISSIALKNKDLIYAKSLFLYFISLIKDHSLVNSDREFNDINVLSNIRNYPSRVKCATLFWHTLSDALKFVF